MNDDQLYPAGGKKKRITYVYVKPKDYMPLLLMMSLLMTVGFILVFAMLRMIYLQET